MNSQQVELVVLVYDSHCVHPFMGVDIRLRVSPSWGLGEYQRVTNMGIWSVKKSN